MWCTPYIEFFNSENYGKRALQPLETATPKRQRQNTDFPEIKVRHHLVNYVENAG